ncbi:glycoside hydrolase [Carnobacterium maltaromaticum]|uniref:glycoside hydrolase family 25 protein n=1 Tax=Carnobacterium maltaromaticum TaxID=2751 RepID=UPI000C786CB3|nr:glycoside hydrolase family 25 protein [Carnobacterium maltaromaticum]PLS36782.1 glycoside hydrolase [Carnobacterium maltaromaticum]PLS37597.1 glycoside hydrolase [Carnobacterium maltaromaticum]PLS39539.1 glycoside hydrolase [Carnobacterium maltaromaticum]PLS44294.1 glycoside hydrolase [Carnobacterium maltaromaticum]PLS46328.1 glycoside hydrolase [Carnobacterium maltaromaticum]
MGNHILDISEWQVPSTINYDVLAGQLSHVIIRVQYGSNYVDKHYKTHISEFQKRGVPVAVYAWVRGVNIADMEQEATDFWNRAKEFNPTFWWLDLEEQTMGDMRSGATAFKNKLKALGANKVGAYVAHHLYKKFNIDMDQFDGVWIPHYGANNGQPNSLPEFPVDLHQYTSVGSLLGYNGHLDLNRIVGNRPLSWFTGGAVSPPIEAEKPSTSLGKATVAPHATQYATGGSIPDWVRGQTYDIIQVEQTTQSISNEKVLLAPIMSWVLSQDIVGGYGSDKVGKPVDQQRTYSLNL